MYRPVSALLSMCLLTGAIAVFGAGVSNASSQPRALVAPCTLTYNTAQICPIAFGAKVGRTQTFIVATYEDLSHCNFPPPGSDPGLNGNYTVAKVSINWGDGSAVTRGVAHVGSACTGASATDETGQVERITGVHRYHRAGTFHLTVSIIYVRGAGNTYPNCTSATGGSVYNGTSNCIALRAPARSVGVVRK
jgi:hypothetical protein